MNLEVVGAVGDNIKHWFDAKAKVISIMAAIILILVGILIFKKPRPVTKTEDIEKALRDKMQQNQKQIDYLQAQRNGYKRQIDSLSQLQAAVQIVYNEKIKYIYLNKYTSTQLDSIVRANW